jgi:GntR family transcriptional regulator/MocR family aminotransferase
MRIPLDPNSEQPLYRQIEAHLRMNIRSGALPADTRLPSTRELAGDLGVSRITVKNAYAELESDGIIESRERSGTFVARLILPPPSAQRAADFEWPLWQQEALANAPAPGQIYHGTPRTAGGSDLIRFTGVGDRGHFPIKDFLKAIQTVVRRDGVVALDYGAYGGGYPPLRETIAQVLASQGIEAHPDQILITSGSQQAIALICDVLLRPGDPILVAKPTYNYALDLFRTLGFKLIGVPIDKDGMKVEMLEPLLQQHHPKLIYTIPNFQNPSGAYLPTARRRALAALAARYNVPILEDDYAGDLLYEGRAQPAVKALDAGGNVIYVGTYSKMLMPGLRLGFLVADGPIFQRLLHHKWLHDFTTSTLIQRTLNEYVTIGRYQAHLRRSRRINRQRRDVMLEAIRHTLPADVHCETPQGGLFLWLRLPEGISSKRLLPLALDAGVEFSPGGWFFPEEAEGARYLRLNFAVQPPERIEEGIRRLRAALDRYP